MDALGDAIRDAAIVFPDAEIGAGASWEVTSHAASLGIHWDRRTRYTLAKLGDDAVDVQIQTVASAPRQPLRTEPRRSKTLRSAKGMSTGTMTIPLREFAATGFTTTSAEAVFVIVSGQLRLTSTIQVDSRYETRRHPQAPVDAAP